MNTTENIEQCIQQLQAGHKSAIGQLIEIAQDRIERLTNHMLRGFPNVKRWQSTGDVFQDSTLKLFQAVEKNAPASAQHFLRLSAKIIRQRLVDLARHYSSRISAAANHATQSQLSMASGNSHSYVAYDRAISPDQSKVEKSWQRLAIHNAIDRLPDKLRDIVELVYYQGTEVTQTHEALGIDPKTARKRWMLARIELQKELESELSE